MTREPTEAEVRAFQSWLQRETAITLSYNVCLGILRHYEPRTREQRCDGSGSLYGRVLMGDPGPVAQRCPGCVNCQGQHDGGLTSQSESTTEQRSSATPPVAPITTLSYVCMYCLKDEHPTPCQEFFDKTRRHTITPSTISTVALDDRTLRAIYSITEAILELQYTPEPRRYRPFTRDNFPGIAEIDKEAQK